MLGMIQHSYLPQMRFSNYPQELKDFVNCTSYEDEKGGVHFALATLGKNPAHFWQHYFGFLPLNAVQTRPFDGRQFVLSQFIPDFEDKVEAHYEKMGKTLIREIREENKAIRAFFSDNEYGMNEKYHGRRVEDIEKHLSQQVQKLLILDAMAQGIADPIYFHGICETQLKVSNSYSGSPYWGSKLSHVECMSDYKRDSGQLEQRSTAERLAKLLALPKKAIRSNYANFEDRLDLDSVQISDLNAMNSALLDKMDAAVDKLEKELKFASAEFTSPCISNHSPTEDVIVLGYEPSADKAKKSAPRKKSGKSGKSK